MELKTKWNYRCDTSALADTGDYESSVTFTNGKEILQSNGEEISDKDCQKFCKLLDKMPDLWSHEADSLRFENSQLQKELKNLRK